MKVAISTYTDFNIYSIIEFHWLYKSWLHSKSDAISKIFAFYNPKIDIGNLMPQHEKIEYIPLIPLTEIDLSWKDYPFINSNWYLTTPQASVLTECEYVLKTDNDVFLTPYFPILQPRLAVFGAGLFANEPDVSIKLSQIAEKWGIKPIFNNIGSTVIAKNNHVLQYSQIQFEYCKKLREEEFPNGYGEWPHWFFGVLTMYAGQLAALAYFKHNMMICGLDCHCVSRDIFSPLDYHIHAWHTDGFFSKHRWRNGEYDSVDFNQLNPDRIADYCLWIAGKTTDYMKG